MPEILSIIIDNLDTTRQNGSNQGLFTLAMTCQTFRQPALDTLYRNLNDMGPLIKCLPRDLWKQRGHELVCSTSQQPLLSAIH